MTVYCRCCECSNLDSLSTMDSDSDGIIRGRTVRVCTVKHVEVEPEPFRVCSSFVPVPPKEREPRTFTVEVHATATYTVEAVSVAQALSRAADLASVDLGTDNVETFVIGEECS